MRVFASLALLLLACVSNREPATGFANRCGGPETAEQRGPCQPEAVTAASPTVVLVLTDDQRADLMGYMPITDSLLRAETVRFSRAFATTSLCCPSRSSILTGLYTHNHGVVWNNAPTGGATVFNPTSTVATWLSAAGWQTALYGKYLNDYVKLNGVVPPGWSEWHAFSDLAQYYTYPVTDNGVITQHGAGLADYSTTYFAAQAVAQILATPDTVPLLLFYTPYAPHRPATPYPTDVGSHSGFPNWRPPSYNEGNVSDKPAWIRALPRFTTSRISAADALHRAQLDALNAADRAVGDLVTALKATGRWDRTLFIVASDNGYMWGEHRLLDVKHCPYEECIRIPLWVRAPGAVARTDTSLVALLDLAPTMAAWAGVPVPAGTNGLDLGPLLVTPGAAWRDDLLIEHLGTPTLNARSDGVRTSRYYYGEYQTTGERELYDLVADPFELVNQAANPAYAGTVAALAARLVALRQE